MTKLEALEALARGAQKIRDTGWCPSCEYDTTDRHRMGCERPERLYSQASSPTTILAMVELLREARDIIKCNDPGMLQCERDWLAKFSAWNGGE